MALGPTQGDEKTVSVQQRLSLEAPLSPCHLDRSVAKWRDLCVDAPSWKCFSCKSSTSRISTGHRRSEVEGPAVSQAAENSALYKATTLVEP
jgi:hypothetical protein